MSAMKVMASMEREMLIKGFSIFRSCGHFDEGMGAIYAILVEGHPKKHFCEIILKSKNWPMRRYRLKSFCILSSGGHFVQRSRTMLAILVKGHPRNISVKF